jgi:hypothetical protein
MVSNISHWTYQPNQDDQTNSQHGKDKQADITAITTNEKNLNRKKTHKKDNQKPRRQQQMTHYLTGK